MKKQFKFAVAIENYTQETFDFCKELGYEVTVYDVTKFDENNFYYVYLINDHGRVNGVVTNIHYLSGQTLCNWETEKDLCKALLAATETDEVQINEYFLNSKGEIIKNVLSEFNYSKPTLTQLLTHFRNKPMKKKIIGYKAKTERHKIVIAKLMILDLMTFDGSFNLKEDKCTVDNLTQLQVLDLWCDPIYEEDKLFLDEEKTVEVVERVGYVVVGEQELDLEAIEQMICLSNHQFVDIYIHNHKVTLEKLEKIKEMLDK
jgi:hypothetical protein